MIHELKSWPEFFDAVDRGEKTFEIRRDDRGFQVGDYLRLERFRPGVGTIGGHYVDRNDRLGSPWFNPEQHAEITVRVTYKMHGGRFGLADGWCILGFVKDGEAGR